MVLQGRLVEMASILTYEPELLVKLSAASLLLNVAVAKIYTYQINVLSELKRDAEYMKELKQAYLDSADDDKKYAEMFAGISAEIDKMMLE